MGAGSSIRRESEMNERISAVQPTIAALVHRSVTVLSLLVR